MYNSTYWRVLLNSCPPHYSMGGKAAIKGGGAGGNRPPGLTLTPCLTPRPPQTLPPHACNFAVLVPCDTCPPTTTLPQVTCPPTLALPLLPAPSPTMATTYPPALAVSSAHPGSSGSRDGSSILGLSPRISTGLESECQARAGQSCSWEWVLGEGVKMGEWAWGSRCCMGQGGRETSVQCRCGYGSNSKPGSGLELELQLPPAPHQLVLKYKMRISCPTPCWMGQTKLVLDSSKYDRSQTVSTPKKLLE